MTLNKMDKSFTNLVKAIREKEVLLEKMWETESIMQDLDVKAIKLQMALDKKKAALKKVRGRSFQSLDRKRGAERETKEPCFYCRAA